MRFARTTSAAALVALVLALCGCWVYTVNPLVEGEDQLIFDRALLGAWWQPEKGCTITFSRFYEEKFYRLVYAAPPTKENGGCLVDPGRTAAFEARMLELNGTRFLDLYPADREKLHHDLSLHSFYKLQTIGDTLTLIPMDYDWTRSQWGAKKLGIPAREGDESLVLTGETKSLQEFVADHSDNEEAFSSKKQFIFHRKSE